MYGFRSRSYRSPGQLLQDCASLATSWRTLPSVLGGGSISAALRERLMLVVTAVNRCRYCAHYHSRVALLTGVTRSEAEALLDGAVESCPQDQVPALLYARHWAETDAHPDPAARQRLIETYGAGTAKEIETVLLLIRMGNLTGNAFDLILHRISGGRLGG